jgi:hypothetical protein
MVTTRPTSRQLQGHFNALRASKSHTANETIDIAAGFYGAGKYYNGVTDISHPSWAGTTSTFYIYLDKDDNLVLDNITGYPSLSTNIARVVIVSGIIFDIIDDRAEVNSFIDAYQVAYDDAGNTYIFADNVQDAITEIDGYIAVGANIPKTWDFDIHGGITNGTVRLSHVSDSPVLAFPRSRIGKVRHSVSLPYDYVDDTDVVIKIFWSVPNNQSADVKWQLKYRIIESNVSDVDVAMTTISYTQTTPGIADRLTDTGNNLKISSGVIDSGDILIFSLERESTSSQDTYNSVARVHLIRMEYTGRGVE